MTFDAADVAWEPTHIGSALGALIYTTERKPRWWQRRARRRWFPPVLLDVDDLSVPPVNGTLTILWGAGIKEET
jgi:hypothetical protein